MVTPSLFAKFPTPEILASSSFEEVLPYISSVTFPNSKTRHLIEMSRKLVSDYKSKVPSEVRELEKLPGCGRKTANVVASVCFGANVIAVDTHVFRVSHRLGLSDGKTPLAVENDLNGIIPEKDRGRAHHWLILHGRYVCTARKPRCSECGLSKWCPSAFSF
jgi:endonuclease-3